MELSLHGGMILYIFSALVAVVLSDLPHAPHQIDCKGQPDGLLEIGCWGYANCINEVPDVNACPVNMVFERDTMKCIKPGDGLTDCYLPTECTAKADGSYADYGDNCQTYYRCSGGLNLGRFYCPTTLAFNENLQLCDYPYNLAPPCGTKGGTQAPTAPTTESTTTPTTTSTPMTTTPPPPVVPVIG